MKKKLSLLLALVMLLATVMAVPTVSVGAAEAEDAIPSLFEGFEDAETLFEDTALWSDAQTQIVTDNPISGEKSLLIEATSDWVNLIGNSCEEFNLAPNTTYRFTVSYRMGNTSDTNIQVMLSDGRYARFNAPGGYMWDGSDIANEYHTTFRTNGDVKTLSVVFTTNSDSLFWLKLQLCWANNEAPLKMYFDDFKLEPIVAEEIYENFEDAASINDTVFSSGASGQKIANTSGVTPISGNKSLYIESNSDWHNILGTSQDEFALAANTEYRFSVSYRMDNTSDTNIQLVLSDGRYARFNAPGAYMWDGNSDVTGASTFTTENGVTKLSVVFTTGSDAGNLKLQVCWAASAPLQMYFDDFKIEPTNGGDAYIEDFEDANVLFEDTALWSDATTQIAAGTESGKALHITNTKADWLALVTTDLSKVALLPDTEYIFSFSYHTPDIAVGNEAYNCCQMQVNISPAHYIRFTAYNPYYVEGAGSITSGYSFRRDPVTGIVTVVLRFRTAADFSETDIRIIGGIWQTADVFGDLDVTFDELHLIPTTDLAMEDFENKNILGETYYESTLPYAEIEESEVFGSKALHVKNNEINAWNALVGLNQSLVQLEADTTYQFSFKYYIAESDDLDSIQLEIKNASNGTTRCVRFNATNFGYDANTTDATLGENMHFEKDEATGIVTVSLVFTTAADGSETAVSLVGDCWAVGVIDAWFDDISICKSNIKYNGVQGKYAVVTASDLENVSEIGYEINGTVAGTTDYINPMVVDNSYFIANDSGVYYGDVNVDGTFDALDLAELRKWLLESKALECGYADINGDSELNIRDLVLCKKVMASVAYEFNTDDFGIDFVYPFLIEETEGTVCPFAIVNGLKVYGLSSTI